MRILICRMLVYSINYPNNFPNKHKKYLTTDLICVTIFFISCVTYSPDANVAFTEILQFKAPEIGQLFFASSTNLSKIILLISGTFAISFSNISTILPSSNISCLLYTSPSPRD